jgi:hypothetical protein
MTSLSKHFMATDVSAMGGGNHLGRLPSLPWAHVGITDSVRKRLKMSVKTLDSWSAHALSTRPGNLSGPEALNVDLF